MGFALAEQSGSRALHRDVPLLSCALTSQPDALARVDAMAQGNSRQDRALEEEMGMLELGSGIPEPGEALSGMEEQGWLRVEL